MAPALRFGLADGHDKHTIATSLFMAPKSVAKHIEYVLTEVPPRSRAEAVAIACPRGLGAFEPRATGRAT